MEGCPGGRSASAYGGILITNTEVDPDTALEIDKLFFEVIIAPSFKEDALEMLKKKKNRIILIRKTQPCRWCSSIAAERGDI